jgi:hypothetical protein
MDGKEAVSTAVPAVALDLENVLFELLVQCGLQRNASDRGRVKALPGEPELLAEARCYLQRHKSERELARVWLGQIYILLYSLVYYIIYYVLLSQIANSFTTWEVVVLLILFNITSLAEVPEFRRYTVWLQQGGVFERWLALLQQTMDELTAKDTKKPSFIRSILGTGRDRVLSTALKTSLSKIAGMIPAGSSWSSGWITTHAIVTMITFVFFLFLQPRLFSSDIVTSGTGAMMFATFWPWAIFGIYFCRVKPESSISYYLISQLNERLRAMHTQDSMPSASTARQQLP